MIFSGEFNTQSPYPGTGEKVVTPTLFNPTDLSTKSQTPEELAARYEAVAKLQATLERGNARVRFEPRGRLVYVPVIDIGYLAEVFGPERVGPVLESMGRVAEYLHGRAITDGFGTYHTERRILRAILEKRHGPDLVRMTLEEPNQLRMNRIAKVRNSKQLLIRYAAKAGSTKTAERMGACLDAMPEVMHHANWAKASLPEKMAGVRGFIDRSIIPFFEVLAGPNGPRERSPMMVT